MARNVRIRGGYGFSYRATGKSSNIDTWYGAVGGVLMGSAIIYLYIVN